MKVLVLEGGEGSVRYFEQGVNIGFVIEGDICKKLVIVVDVDVLIFKYEVIFN